MGDVVRLGAPQDEVPSDNKMMERFADCVQSLLDFSDSGECIGYALTAVRQDGHVYTAWSTDEDTALAMWALMGGISRLSDNVSAIGDEEDFYDDETSE